jgi:hypothetical protein
MGERWHGDTHYYEYDRLERLESMDAYKVAEAYIYNADGAALGIILMVSAQELRAGIKLADALAEARRALSDPVSERQGEAATIGGDRSDLYTWNGLFVLRML